jgi:hypothetical protein
MNPSDHERHSERLSAYVGGTLGPEETEETRAHLAGCPMCRQEEAALVALISSPVEGLRPDESERLRHAVLAEISSEEAPSLSVVPSEAAFVEPRRSWAPRIAQFMAAAAVIALAAIYLTNPGNAPIGGADQEAPAANGADDLDGGSDGRLEEQTAEEATGGGGSSGGTNDVAAEGDTVADTTSGKDGDGKRNAEGTRTGSGSEGGAVAVGTPEQGNAPDAVTAMKVNEAAFGVRVAYRGQR